MQSNFPPCQIVTSEAPQTANCPESRPSISEFKCFYQIWTVFCQMCKSDREITCVKQKVITKPYPYPSEPWRWSKRFVFKLIISFFQSEEIFGWYFLRKCQQMQSIQARVEFYRKEDLNGNPFQDSEKIKLIFIATTLSSSLLICQ